jgi:hypothetical protein
MIREKENFKDLKTKSHFIRLLLPAGEAMSAPPLSAILGQAQVNSSEFCKVFNAFSIQHYENGVILNVDLYRNLDNSYYFVIRSISFPYILFQISDSNRYIPVELLYDAFTVKLLSIKKKMDFNSARLLFGSMRSMGFNVILLCNTYHAFIFQDIFMLCLSNLVKQKSFIICLLIMIRMFFFILIFTIIILDLKILILT